MATERTSPPHSTHPEGEPTANVNVGATALPSQRVVIPPPPGSDEAAFLDNLNEVCGVDESADVPAEGIRRHMRIVLADTL